MIKLSSVVNGGFTSALRSVPATSVNLDDVSRNFDIPERKENNRKKIGKTIALSSKNAREVVPIIVSITLLITPPTTLTYDRSSTVKTGIFETSCSMSRLRKRPLIRGIKKEEAARNARHGRPWIGVDRKRAGPKGVIDHYDLYDLRAAVVGSPRTRATRIAQLEYVVSLLNFSYDPRAMSNRESLPGISSVKKRKKKKKEEEIEKEKETLPGAI